MESVEVEKDVTDCRSDNTAEDFTCAKDMRSQIMQSATVTMAHGSGGSATEELIHQIFAEAFSNDTLNQMEDAAVIPWEDFFTGKKGKENILQGTGTASSAGRLALTTDSFVVTPLFFRGGDIGRLAVCGTVNDLLMRGAVPGYLTCGWILEEGTPIELIRRAAESMARTAAEAGVCIVAGDTKVIEGRQGGIYINTTGAGYVPDGVDIAAGNARAGDVIIVSGTMGDHHAAILSERMKIENGIKSDAAPLTEMVSKLEGLPVHTLRDITRGGLATVCKELALASKKTFLIRDYLVPVEKQVKDFCGLLGLDPFYMGNEGKLVCIVEKAYEEKALEAIRSSRYGEHAAVIGEVTEEKEGALLVETAIGGRRELDVLQGEGLPRIC